MRKMFILARTLLKSGGLLSSKKSGTSKWIIPVVLLIAFASFAFSTVMMTFGLYDLLAPVGAAEAILPLAFGATSIVIFLFGIFYVISVMYHADETEMLMYLPLRPYQILGAKFITLILYEYIFEAFILLPILTAYAVKVGADVLFIVYSVMLFALLPIIALSMAAIIVMIVMRFTSFGKNKQAFRFVGGIIALVLALGLNIVLQSSVRDVSQAQLIAMATGQSSFVTVISKIFPGILFASNALIESTTVDGLLNLLLFIVCSAAAAALFFGFGQLLYLKGVAGVSETAAKRKEISKSEFEKQTQSTSAVRAYVKKEMRQLVRSPIAFLNCVLMNFLWPVILVIMLVGSGSSLDMVGGYVAQMDTGLIIAILVGVAAFVSSANAITSTAISREGKSLYISKYIPMRMQSQLTAKIATGMIFSGAGIVLIFVAGIVIGVSLPAVLIAFVLSIIVVAVCSVMGLLIDVANPKLDWMNEQQAIKQNLNVMLHMLLGVVFAAAAIVPVLAFGMPWAAACIYIAVLFVALLLILYGRIKNYAVPKLENMDV